LQMLSVKNSIVLTCILIGATACLNVAEYSGPDVTRIVIRKSERQLTLMSSWRPIKTYEVDLGFNPVGHKISQGDGRTPEGRYRIDRHNPQSKYYLSLGISYPNAKDIEAAKALGQDPGGDIYIHGGAIKYRYIARKDWTYGCISVTNREIEEIYAMVSKGTIVDILP